MQLLVRPQNGRPAETRGFEHLSFVNWKLKPGQRAEGDTGESELGLVILGGICSVTSSRGDWKSIGRRPNVFAGMPYGLYLPIDPRYTVVAETECDLAFCFSRAEEAH